MREFFRKGWVKLVTAIVAVVFIAIVAFGMYVAGQAGQLPWQTDPTRIAVVPFSDIPGFETPTPIPTKTPTVGTPAP